MNPNTYKRMRRAISPKQGTPDVRGPIILNSDDSFFNALLNAPIKSSIAIAFVLFAAFSVGAIAAVASPEIGMNNDAPVSMKVAAKNQGYVLGDFTLASPISVLASTPSIYITYSSTGFSSDLQRWSYNFEFKRKANLSGSIKITAMDWSLVYSQNVNREDNVTVFNGFMPSTKYRLDYYTKEGNKGSVLTRKYFTTLPVPNEAIYTPPIPNQAYCTQDAKQCPDGSFVGRVAPSCQFAACPIPNTPPYQPSYGYSTVWVNPPAQGSLREGWVETFTGTGSNGLSATGWAFNEDKLVIVTANFQNVGTGQFYPATISYFDYRPDIQGYISAKTGKVSKYLDNAFTAKAENLPYGTYKLITIAYDGYPFNIHNQAVNNNYAGVTVGPSSYPYPVPSVANPRTGQLINKNGTVFFVGSNGLYGIPNMDVFNSWGYSFSLVLEANNAETNMFQTGLVPYRNPGCNTPQEQINNTCSNASVPIISTKTQNPSYGYYTLDVGTVPQGKWREGWVESIYTTANNGVAINGWAFDIDALVGVSVTFQNMSTGQNYPASVSYSNYRADVQGYLANKTGKALNNLNNAFIAKAENLPSGNYKFTIATYNGYAFNVHGQVTNSNYIGVTVGNTTAPFTSNISTKQPSYGYFTLDVGTVPQGSWREGWVESFFSYGNTLTASGWAFNQDNLVIVNLVFQNINTGQTYSTSNNYQNYRYDVQSYLAGKIGKTPNNLNNVFTATASNLPPGNYRLLAATYDGYAFNIQNQVISSSTYGVSIY